MRLFLGGTTAGGDWRSVLIPLLKEEGIEYFNPIVDDWDEEAQKREYEEKQKCSHRLYLITPFMKGVFSIAEAVDDSNKCPNSTIFAYMNSELEVKFNVNYPTMDFDDAELSSLAAVESMIKANGAFTCKVTSIKHLFEFIKYVRDETRDIDIELN